jgi:hypothetical protein
MAAELEDIDLAKAFSRLSKLAVRIAADIPLELRDQERALEVIDALHETARLVEVQLLNAPPSVIDEQVNDDRLADQVSGLIALLQNVEITLRMKRCGMARRRLVADMLATVERAVRESIPTGPPKEYGWSASGPPPELPPRPGSWRSDR